MDKLSKSTKCVHSKERVERHGPKDYSEVLRMSIVNTATEISKIVVEIAENSIWRFS